MSSEAGFLSPNRSRLSPRSRRLMFILLLTAATILLSAGFTAVVNAAAGADPSVLYTAYYGAEGTHPQDAMKAKLDLLMKNLQVTEH